MASIKKINAGGTTYDIDATTWKGKSTLKTINYNSLFNSGNIDTAIILDLNLIYEHLNYSGDNSIGFLNQSIPGSLAAKLFTIFSDYLNSNNLAIPTIYAHYSGLLLPTYVYIDDSYINIIVYSTSSIINDIPIHDEIHGRFKFSINDIVNGETSILCTISDKPEILISGYDIATIGGRSMIDGGNIPIKTINGNSIFGSTDISLSNYTTCSTSSSTLIKEIQLPNVKLVEGTRIWVNFTNGNYASGELKCKCTNIAGTTTCQICLNGTSGVDNSTTDPIIYAVMFDPGVYELIFIGGHFHFTGSMFVDYKSNSIPNPKKPYIKLTTESSTSSRFDFTYDNITPDVHTSIDTNMIRSLRVNSIVDCSFDFMSGTGLTFIYPSSWRWANGIAPYIKPNKRYHVSVKNLCAVIAEFDV